MGERAFKWGEDYGKDLLVDLNQLAHARGTGALFRDVLTRAYTEIVRLRKQVAELNTPTRSASDIRHAARADGEK